MVPPPPVPKVKILADKKQQKQRLALYKLLAGCGRLLPVKVPPERVPFAGGMFAVPKDLDRDRLVLDARPSNVLGGCPSYWSAKMASASALLGLVLPSEQTFRISTADLQDYFFTCSRFRRSGSRRTFCMALSPCVKAPRFFGRECHDFADAKGRVTVALSSLAMGDASAVEFAQGAHVGVLYRHGVLRAEEMLLPTGPVVHRGGPGRFGDLGEGVLADGLCFRGPRRS